MSQETEIEVKNLITKEEFETLCAFFSVTTFTKQVNHYFETKDQAIKDHGCALRIRFKHDTYILTLKQPLAIGLLETHQELTKDEAAQMMETGQIVEGQVATILKSMNITTPLTYYGRLTTERAEIKYKGGVLVFDHSFYFQEDDYELEYEVDEEYKTEAFFQLLSHYKIPIRPTKNKVQRFFLAKQKNVN
ncbi:CYTH domain-containing protein [Ectobacillus sp. sgz5001026]|uniref:CYTH domain-containing protein n=1 Tax=Ectobacillus sp. sgz5001026 TaxID=3242473 RepID=UPI0036D25674